MTDLFGNPIQPTETLSATQRRTQRQRWRQANGLHPLRGWPLAGNGQTCGTCKHLLQTHGRRWFKCAKWGGGSAATDIRKSWPACFQWAAAS